MSIFSILESLFIGPLKLIFEVIFAYANRFVGNPGLAIVFLSLIMNILVLPLYRRADAMQEQSRDIEAKLHDMAAHIKKTFSGDERMMILQEYYRQNHYKPTDALKGSVSLLLEIPFFMAAYQFLSNLEILDGVSLGPIRDLGSPDGMLVIGGFAINLLPILMTAVNVVSSAIYLRGFPMKTKVQLYAMAAFFLVFLYNSPACLAFYWTLNNLFSLVKTIFYKLKDPKKVLRVLSSVLGIAAILCGAGIFFSASVKLRVLAILMGLALQMPLFLHIMKKKGFFAARKEAKADPVPNRKLFLICSVFLSALLGLLIPSTIISASPQEFVDITYFHHPLWYVVSCFCLAAGTFLVWMRVFYWLASPKGKVIFEKLVFTLCGVTLVDYMFFGTDLGNLSYTLQYDTGVNFTAVQKLVNLLVLAILAAGLLFFVSKWKRAAAAVVTVAAVALCGMSAVHLVTIKSSIDKISLDDDIENSAPRFQLSKTGKNVVVLMLDKAMGEYIPYIMQEKPELKEQFAGFTYYGNTISFGGCTNYGLPALLGGYEYTPVEMNKRSTESLMSKHNEALKVMPVLFSENGYKVTVCDPTYANYQWIPDLSIYDDYPEIKSYITRGRFGDASSKKDVVEKNHRNFFCFSIMKTMPLVIQPTIYNGGGYHQISEYLEQKQYTISKSSGLSSIFMEPYYVLENLTEMTRFTEEGTNTFLFLSNDTTHNPMLLQEPAYIPAQEVDNTRYDAEHTERFQWNGKEMKVDTVEQMIYYHANMATMLRLGEWFDSLRAEGVYDNTRIILVSDHGWALEHFDELTITDESGTTVNVEGNFPLLMVKDFGEETFTMSDDFMTNADVPVLAMTDLIDNPVNPFTGKKIDNAEKYAHDQFVVRSGNGDVATNNGNIFLPSFWASVKDNLWDKNNWTIYGKEMVLDDYAAPKNAG